ncbi:MAG: preprotein translocase subunit SecA [Candidatus Schekmanbacteria bacterium RIFCSPHIGHO2_02_FULL_38_11]|uniref:Protein translocase subunit SecA n=1 Tax=Candidatus Schekmanbacteria bacterium RIFCSPLOWO2_12_FULL_38_15 TaxID=1817883 RepID=A0A1F7SFG7_9BACT|nr:MAG: preprotein translocase subunit SecA [Candidatus Schekmanbacteria bacterium GWA2_38_9]OGL50953.1 MAG: preprotein translocase subunit SecA [Candidatus Schekmanbacteria bacterium RIFCSPHIGHO2_02_FULL_38_11]OGL51656.1 MAG: preprotein translocase subunit SecA [Candidatus Schekmanbacteria bacterium RIFCSPLOWO2_02_FULL_38_14]OGL52505.1 MAG: preprotein translocase subunit SecA [Candidatus Schekmanbacteria bacterium RIFCSPLOWO2_12_FULL_38_15]
MIGTLLRKVIGSKNDRDLKAIQPIVERINSLEPEIRKLSDVKLMAKTSEFKERTGKGESLDDILCESFAVVREASRRVLGMRHFDVQLIGGMILHQGKIAEMKTGEGKTLVATLSVYLNALTGKGVHVVTVNDYLARRDSEWMGGIYKFLGLSVGLIQHDMYDEKRKESYNSDITYGTNNEFGFDYLRDNMKFRIEDYCQRELNYAIVDEVDSILVDEARTPLIISGPTEESTDKYYIINKLVPRLKVETDYKIDEKARTVSLSEDGVAKAEKFLNIDNLYDPKNIELIHHVHQALKAYTLFKRDVDYVVNEGEVVIVDEFTGRLMPGRRYSEGLHQALEAKENVKIANENQTLATITFQNYFRMYKKLAGMTGTADTEAEEFHKIYKLEVAVIPANKPLNRKEHPDIIYRTVQEKFKAVVTEIEDYYRREQPVLVGTISIEKSELLSSILKKKGISHNVLNAKYHEKEAEIVAQAGRKGNITIATNMAGRGTDIVLGGVDPETKEKDPEREADVVKLGGLHILGTERHESRRIDNQLRGRSGRQGDPGSSRFYLSMEDDLLRIFGMEKTSNLMKRIGMEEDQPIEHPWVSKSIERAQKNVEAHNFSIRKQLLEYDDVMNKQREVIYEQRRMVLESENLEDAVSDMIDDIVEGIYNTYEGEEDLETQKKEIEDAIYRQFRTDRDDSGINFEGLEKEEQVQKVSGFLKEIYGKKREERREKIGERADNIERMVMLQVIDNLWKDNLLAMDHLKEGIGLRGYGQRDPLVEYKREGYEMFQNMIERIKEETVDHLFKIELVSDQEIYESSQRRLKDISMNRGEGEEKKKPSKRESGKVGRNDPCPCGSGKKYKKCCGMIGATA